MVKVASLVVVFCLGGKVVLWSLLHWDGKEEGKVAVVLGMVVVMVGGMVYSTHVQSSSFSSFFVTS